MSTQEYETEIVTGIVAGIVQKAADKWQVEVSTGGQNPRRLWTKDAMLVQQVSGLIGQTLAFNCGVSHWTNNQGQPMRSLWVNGFGQPGAAPQTAPQTQQPVAAVVQYPQPVPVAVVAAPAASLPMQQAPAPPSSDEREKRIMRQSASKVAVQLLGYMPDAERTFPNLILLSERLLGYYTEGAPWMGHPEQADPGSQGAPHSDSDIPF